ncbi:YciI family protein [Paraburkholderia sp. EG287B]|uniref:YciI family protein n=1 Tax=unclassified Paraburkholderia TaxID=2615204 RepID=UPI0034D164D3
MPFLIHCLYRPGGATERLPIRREHILYMLDWLPLTVFGSAIIGGDGEGAVGMVVVLDVESESDVQRFVAGEPYCRSGLFETITVNPLVQMTPPYTRDFLERELEKCQ